MITTDFVGDLARLIEYCLIFLGVTALSTIPTLATIGVWIIMSCLAAVVCGLFLFVIGIMVSAVIGIFGG
jgi:hypothetical protein